MVFAGAPFVGEGTVSSFSRTGCSIRCNRSVLSGSYVRLGVLLPILQSALLVELARVRWVAEHSFGVEFIKLPRLANQALDQASWERLTSLLERRLECIRTPAGHRRVTDGFSASQNQEV